MLLTEENMPRLCEINKQALQYAIDASPRMKELAEPLQKYMGIASFSYMRIYNDCSYLSLLNGYEEFSKVYFENVEKSDPHFIQTMQSALPNEPQFSIWPTDRSNLTPIFSLLDAYDIWHGFQITYRRENYCELFSFTFNKQADDKTDFFLKNIPLLLKFADYFRSHAGDLIDDSDKAKIAIFPEKFSIDPLDNLAIDKFLSELDRPFILKGSDGNIVQLTKRESECLKIFSSNKTAKEIANIINISPRTVELHLSNIKQKLGINYKNELLKCII